MTVSSRPDPADTRRLEPAESELVAALETGENTAFDDAPVDGPAL